MLGSIVGGALALGGALIGASSSKNSAKSASRDARMAQEAEIAMQRETNLHNSQEAALLRAWQENMSNTAHRREMYDLQLAGLNPILTATGGPGATTPSGAKAEWESPGKGMTANTIAAGKNKLVSQQQQIDIWNNVVNSMATQAQTRLANQQTATSAAQMDLQKAQERKTEAETLNVIKSNPKIESETRFIESQIRLNNADELKRQQERLNLVQALETDRNLALRHAADARLAGNKSLESQKIQEAQELQLKIERAANEAKIDNAPFKPYLDSAESVFGTLGEAKDFFNPLNWGKGGKKK